MYLYLISLCEKWIGWSERKCYEQTELIWVDFLLLFLMNAGPHLWLLMYLEYSCVIVPVFPSKWVSCLDVTINQFFQTSVSRIRFFCFPFWKKKKNSNSSPLINANSSSLDLEEKRTVLSRLSAHRPCFYRWIFSNLLCLWL